MLILSILLVLNFANAVQASSLFDEYVKGYGGIPNLETFRKMSKSGVVNGIAVKPSRSLQKDREVFEIPFRGQTLFVGVSRDGKSVEAISDDLLARPPANAFQIFDTSKTPPVQGSNDGCLSCHQNGGPHFSREPWADVHSLKRANTSHADADAFDIVLRGHNARMQARQVCSSICPARDWNCRSALLEMTLKSQANRPFTFFREELAQILASRKGTLEGRLKENISGALPKYLRDNMDLLKWDEGGFGHPSSVLPDVKTEAKTKSVFLGTKEEHYDEDTAQQALPLQLKSNPAEMELADPFSIRPIRGKIERKNAATYLAVVAPYCVGMYDEDEALARILPTESIDDALKKPAFRRLLRDNAWPPTLDELHQAMLESFPEKFGEKAKPEVPDQIKREGKLIPHSHFLPEAFRHFFRDDGSHAKSRQTP